MKAPMRIGLPRLQDATPSNTHDISRDQFMLTGALAKQGYDWWWHSFTGYHAITGQKRAFFIEFFLVNPALAEDEPVFGQLPQNKAEGKRPSYLMVKAGCWGQHARQLHRFFPWREVAVGSGTPYYVAADDCLATETDLVGRVNVAAEDAAAHPEWMCDDGRMMWDLHVDKQIAFNVGYGASEPMRASGAFEMFWHAEGMKTAYAGSVWLDGERYIVDPSSCWGYADKNWGRDFTSPWVWLASSDLTSMRSGKRLRNSAFDIGGGRPKIAGIALERQLLGQIVYEGTPYEFNFSKPWTGSTTQFDCREADDEIVWHVQQDTLTARLVTDIRCPKREMLLVNYEAPDGAKRHNRLWNGGTGTGQLQLFRKHRGDLELIDDIRAASVGCEYGEYDD